MSVLSGNRNFEGRINADVKANYLMSPSVGRGLRIGRIHRDRPLQGTAGELVRTASMSI